MIINIKNVHIIQILEGLYVDIESNFLNLLNEDNDSFFNVLSKALQIKVKQEECCQSNCVSSIVKAQKCKKWHCQGTYSNVEIYF